MLVVVLMASGAVGAGFTPTDAVMEELGELTSGGAHRGCSNWRAAAARPGRSLLPPTATRAPGMRGGTPFGILGCATPGRPSVASRQVGGGGYSRQ